MYSTVYVTAMDFTPDRIAIPAIRTRYDGWIARLHAYSYHTLFLDHWRCYNFSGEPLSAPPLQIYCNPYMHSTEDSVDLPATLIPPIR